MEGWSDGAAIALHLAMHYPERVRALIITPIDLGTNALTDVFRKDLKRWNMPEKLTRFWLTRESPAREDLARIRVPTLFVVGEKEQYVKLDHVAWQSKSIPNAEVVWIPGGDHFFVMEKPQETAMAFLSFLSKH